MRGIIRELLTAFLVLTALYLVLINFTGFGKDVTSVGNAGIGLFKVAQGR